MIKLQALYAYLAHLSKREKFVFYIALVFISLAALDRLIVSPISLKIKSLNKEIETSEANIKNDLHILSQKDRILSESARYTSFLSSNKTEEEEITGLLKEVENLANKASAYITDMKPAPTKELGSSKKYLVNLNCEGQMEQIINFMYNIEDSSKLLVIEKYQISPKSKESGVATVSMTISKTVIPQ
jgi:Tfp pilus assembly protein PilO